MASASTHHQEDDGGETWELVRAFAEDTNSVMGTIWPPRAYNCSYCRREFRSAQALGGHMNVHRRDRANNYYQQTHNYNNPSAAAAPTSTTSNPPAADLSSNKVVPPPNRIDSREPAALCLLCQFPSPSSRSAGTAFGGPLSLDDACLKETVNRGGGGGGGGGGCFIFHSNWCRPNGSCCSLVPPPSTAGLKNTASSARMVELVSVVTTAEPESNNDINAGSSSSSVQELSGGLEIDLELRLGHTQGTR